MSFSFLVPRLNRVGQSLKRTLLLSGPNAAKVVIPSTNGIRPSFPEHELAFLGGFWPGCQDPVIHPLFFRYMTLSSGSTGALAHIQPFYPLGVVVQHGHLFGRLRRRSIAQSCRSFRMMQGFTSEYDRRRPRQADHRSGGFMTCLIMQHTRRVECKHYP